MSLEDVRGLMFTIFDINPRTEETSILERQVQHLLWGDYTSSLLASQEGLLDLTSDPAR